MPQTDPLKLFGLDMIDIMRLGVLLFLAITFLQAGLDKLFDFKNNRDYFVDHFKKSIIAKQAGALLPVIMIMEIGTGVLSVIGAISLFSHDIRFGFYATVLAMATLLCLFFGQRIAKFYGEASGIVPYIIFVLLGMFVFSF